MLMRPLSVSTASASDCSIARTCVTTSTRRRSNQSTHTPAKGATRNVGICPAKPTIPSSKAELVSLYTSQLVAIRVIHVPINEILCPVKNSRKLRCRSARQIRAAVESRAAAPFTTLGGVLRSFPRLSFVRTNSYYFDVREIADVPTRNETALETLSTKTKRPF